MLGAFTQCSNLPDCAGAQVMIVEDDRSSRIALSALLRSCGYQIRAASSAEEALKALKVNYPSVIIVDLNLPGMDGMQLIHQLQKAEAAIFPILVSANEVDAALSQLRQRGVTYLRKPIDFDDLLRLVRAHCPII